VWVAYGLELLRVAFLGFSVKRFGVRDDVTGLFEKSLLRRMRGYKREPCFALLAVLYVDLRGSYVWT
jgi:hypothetical protein